MLVGGLLLGVGFIISGYCPGTSVVATASGNLDGVFTFVGVIIGSLIFAEGFPVLGKLYHARRPGAPVPLRLARRAGPGGGAGGDALRAGLLFGR